MQIRRSIGAGLVALSLLTAAACGASGTKKDAATTATTTTAGGTATTTTTAPAESTTTTSGSQTVPVKEWADGFCKPFGTWLKDIKAASAKVKAAPTTTVAEKKAAIEALFDDAATATDTFITAAGALPAPDMKNGDQIGPDLLSKFKDFKTESIATKEKVAAASDTDAAAFKTTATTAITAFQANVKTIGDSFSALDTKYPDRAFQSALKSSCSSALAGG